MASAGDVVDRISALPDDLLHHILGFVCDAKSVVRTAALSRRWRRVWIYTPKLALLGPGPGVDPGNFVDSVFAQRGDADIESLRISMSRSSSLPYTSQEKVNGWLRYAMQRVVKSFLLDLPNPRPSWPPLRSDGPAVVLPGRGRMACMRMFLTSCYSFQLPVAASAKYEALTELTLYNASFFDDDGESSAGGGRTLGDFVSSSCCPRLRKLEISNLKGLAQLKIRTGTLEWFNLASATDLRVLDVTAAKLGVIQLSNWFGDDSNHKTRIIASSKLQEIAMWHQSSHGRLPDLVIHNLKSVCRLHIQVNMHGQYYVTDVGVWLLEKCPSVEHVGVWLIHRHSPTSVIEGQVIADLTVEGAAPFASVRSMGITVNAHFFQDDQLVSSIFALLLRCPRLRSLRIHINDDTTNLARSWTCSFCVERYGYAWTDHRSISLESLEDVKIIGFRGADEDLDLVRLLFASSKNSIKSMTLDNITETCGPGTVSLERVMAEDGTGTETIDQKLLNIPTVDRGRWHFGDTIYTWTAYAT